MKALSGLVSLRSGQGSYGYITPTALHSSFKRKTVSRAIPFESIGCIYNNRLTRKQSIGSQLFSRRNAAGQLAWFTHRTLSEINSDNGIIIETLESLKAIHISIYLRRTCTMRLQTFFTFSYKFLLTRVKEGLNGCQRADQHSVAVQGQMLRRQKEYVYTYTY